MGKVEVLLLLTAKATLKEAEEAFTKTPRESFR